MNTTAIEERFAKVVVRITQMNRDILNRIIDLHQGVCLQSELTFFSSGILTCFKGNMPF